MTQPRYCAVVTDLDGTIVVDDGSVDSGTISTATLCAAAELVARGVPLIVATGRTPAGVRALGPLLPYLAGAVCCTGAVGWTPATGRIAWQDSIPTATVREVVRLVTTHLPGAGIAAYDGRRWALTEPYVSARGSLPRGPSEIVAGAAAIADRPACAVAVCHQELTADEQRRLLAQAGLDLTRVSMTTSAAKLLDIAPVGVDKATGVGRVLETLGVAPADTIAVGDMPNDLPMLRLCGHPVAVGNAHPDVLAAATMVTGSVRQDGFARLLVTLGLVDGHHNRSSAATVA